MPPCHPAYISFSAPFPGFDPRRDLHQELYLFNYGHTWVRCSQFSTAILVIAYFLDACFEELWDLYGVGGLDRRTAPTIPYLGATRPRCFCGFNCAYTRLGINPCAPDTMVDPGDLAFVRLSLRVIHFVGLTAFITDLTGTHTGRSPYGRLERTQSSWKALWLA